MALASTGSPGRIGGVHIDVITAIRAPRSFTRTTTAIETGAPVQAHRQREPYPLELDVLISDAEPIVGVGFTPLWEAQHAAKTRARLLDLLERGTIVEVFDGRDKWRTPTGTKVWVIDGVDDQRLPEDNPRPGQPSTWRATIRIGEVPLFSTSFTPLDPDIDESIQDIADGIVDTGQQSTERVPADIAAKVPA